jgi:hypothetical protein
MRTRACGKIPGAALRHKLTKLGSLRGRCLGAMLTGPSGFSPFVMRSAQHARALNISPYSRIEKFD